MMRIETALAQGSMTRVERRDPKNFDHKMTSSELEKISPDFQWQVYFTKVGLTFAELAKCDLSQLFQDHERGNRKGKLGGLESLFAVAPGACSMRRFSRLRF